MRRQPKRLQRGVRYPYDGEKHHRIGGIAEEQRAGDLRIPDRLVRIDVDREQGEERQHRPGHGNQPLGPNRRGVRPRVETRAGREEVHDGWRRSVRPLQHDRHPRGCLVGSLTQSGCASSSAASISEDIPTSIVQPIPLLLRRYLYCGETRNRGAPMRVVLADLQSNDGFVSKDTVAGGYGLRFRPFSRVTRVIHYLKRRYANLPSVQLAYVAAELARFGHDVTTSQGEATDADVAIVLSSLVDYRHETEWADRMRARGTEVGFVGLAASKMPQLFVGHADFVVSGEPEEAARRLARGERLRGIVKSAAAAISTRCRFRAGTWQHRHRCEASDSPPARSAAAFLCSAAGAALSSAPTAPTGSWPRTARGRSAT